MTGRMRRMAAEFQGQFMEAMREAELDDLRKEVERDRTGRRQDSVKLDVAFDPLTEARKQIIGGDRGAADAAAKDENAAATSAEDDGAVGRLALRMRSWLARQPIRRRRPPT